MNKQLNDLVYCISESLTPDSTKKEIQVAARFFAFLQTDISKDLVCIFESSCLEDAEANVDLRTENFEELYIPLFYLNKHLSKKMPEFIEYLKEFSALY